MMREAWAARICLRISDKGRENMTRGDIMGGGGMLRDYGWMVDTTMVTDAGMIHEVRIMRSPFTY